MLFLSWNESDPWHMNANTAFIGVTEPWNIYVNHDTAFYMSSPYSTTTAGNLNMHTKNTHVALFLFFFSDCQFMLIAH